MQNVWVLIANVHEREFPCASINDREGSHVLVWVLRVEYVLVPLSHYFIPFTRRFAKLSPIVGSPVTIVFWDWGGSVINPVKILLKLRFESTSVELRLTALALEETSAEAIAKSSAEL
ncbi:hypothetical protein D3C86_1863870 [compost metagenome]